MCTKIKLLSSCKAPGSDAIPAEIYKVGGPALAQKLTELFRIIWRKEAIPQEFKDATIIHLFKRKWNPQAYPFPVKDGVKQGCVLASTLFSMMFSAMLRDAFLDGDNVIPIRYRFDGKLFNLRRLQAKSNV